MAIVADLDGTLTSGRMWQGLGNYLRQHGRRWAFYAFMLPRIPGGYLAKVGRADAAQYRHRFILDLPRLFKGLTPTEWQRVAEWVVEHELWPKRHDQLLTQLIQQQQAGQRIIVASGAYQPILEAFIGRFGFEGIGTPLEMKNGRATGSILGQVNVGEVKAHRIQTLLGDDEIVTAYGDTVSDVPMLLASQTAVAVAPDPQLEQIARERGWQILTHFDVCTIPI